MAELTLLPKRRTVDGITATRRMRRVLLALLTDAGNLSMSTIARAAGVSGVSVFACLDKLEARGWMTGTFASGPYPRRRFYRLTPEGWGFAHQLLELTPGQGRRG